MLSYYEAAVFSKLSYVPDGDPSTLSEFLSMLDKPWERSLFFETDRDLGISIFTNHDEKKTVIAFRGTKKISNFFSDFQILMGWPIDTEAMSREFFEARRDQFYPNLIFTGHSLGGALACLMALQYDIPAITFDAPGCHRIASYQKKPQLLKNKLLVTSILGQPNLINTCDKHLGTLLFANTSPIHDSIGSTIDVIERHKLIASLLVSPLHLDSVSTSVKTVDTTLSARSTFYLHKMQHFLDFLNPNKLDNERVPLLYIRKWCNSLNHVFSVTSVPRMIRQIETSQGPVEEVDNPETLAALVETSILSYESKILSNSSSIFTSGIFSSTLSSEEKSEKDTVDSRVVQPKSRTCPMPSRIAQYGETFDQRNWIISIINYTRDSSVAAAIGGHSILLVEGRLPDGQFFVGKYDIRAAVPENSSAINITGHISDIIVEESIPTELYESDQPYQVVNIRDHHMTRYLYTNIRPENVKDMIQSIKEDAEKTERAKRGEGNYIPYQLIGQGRGGLFMFIPTEEGINCADWCLGKLRDGAGIQNVGGKKDKSKPTFSASSPSIGSWR